MKIRILLFILCMNFSVLAQEQKMSAAEISAFKTSVEKETKTIQSLKTDFIQYKHLSFLSKDIETSGKMYFKSPNLLNWQYTNPYQYSIIFKNNKVYINDQGKKSSSSENFQGQRCGGIEEHRGFFDGCQLREREEDIWQGSTQDRKACCSQSCSEVRCCRQDGHLEAHERRTRKSVARNARHSQGRKHRYRGGDRRRGSRHIGCRKERQEEGKDQRLAIAAVGW